MKNSNETHNLGRSLRAIIFLFWFLVVGTCPAAFGAAVSVDVLWGGLFDNSGQPLASGKVYTYSAGTTNAKATYTDSAKTSPAANPVVLDGYGRAQIYADGSYKFVIKTADDVTLMTIDNLEYVSSQNPSALSTTSLSATGATIGSLTAMIGTLVNMTISSATITLANLVSPNIANASMTGTLYSPTIANGTFTGTINLSSATVKIASPTAFTDPVNLGYLLLGLPTPGVASDSAPATVGFVKTLISAFGVPAFDFNTVGTIAGFSWVNHGAILGYGMVQIPGSEYTISSSNGTKYFAGDIQFSASIATGVIVTFAIRDASGTFYDCAAARNAGTTDYMNVPFNLRMAGGVSSGTSKVFSVWGDADSVQIANIYSKSGLAASWRVLKWDQD